MPIIKNSSAARLVKDAIVLDLGDLHRQGQEILARAQAEGTRILDDAGREALRIIDGAAEAGRAQGLERGLAEGREIGERNGRQEAIDRLAPRIEHMLQSWSAAIERWERERGDMLLAAKEDVLAFALAAAQKIVFRIVQTDRTVVQDQLAEALSLLSQPSAVVVAVNPDDRALVEEVLPELVAQLRGCEHVALRDEPGISPGGCIVTTAGGEIDARIETQLDRIAEALAPGAADGQPDVHREDRHS
jgi:flagellar assembly protein FliH